MTTPRALCVAAPLLLALSGTAFGDVIWNEAVNGDLSNDRFNPTALVLTPGVHSLIATSQGGDREFVRMTFTAALGSIVHVSWVSLDTTGFIGVQAGPTFTENPDAPNVANILGYTHFGSGPGTIGQNILPQMGTGPGSIGFTPPLAAGVYTFWIQQLGGPSTYQLDFNVIPAPGAGALAAAGLALLARRRR